MEIDTLVPPCIAQILENKNLLHDYAKHVLRFVNQYLKDQLSKYIEMMVKEGINIDLSVDCFSSFNCSDLQQFCDPASCPLKSDIFNWILNNVEEVYKTMDGDSVIIIVKLRDGKEIWLDLSSDNLGRNFIAQIAYHYNIVIDFDMRRKSDKERWILFLNELVRRAKEVRPYQIDEDKEYIRKVALDYLFNIPVKPAHLWKGDINTAIVEGDYAYFPKDTLRSYLSIQTGKRISMKELSQLLQPDVQTVWRSFNGTYKAFCKFKLSEKQKKMLKEVTEQVKEVKQPEEVSEAETAGSGGSDSSFEYEEWDMFDVMGN